MPYRTTHPAQPNDERVPDDQRKGVLARAIANAVGTGQRVETRIDDYAVVMVSGKAATNHTFHLLMSIFTAGIWLPVWAIASANNREHRFALSVDAYGNILNERLS